MTIGMEEFYKSLEELHGELGRLDVGKNLRFLFLIDLVG